MPKDWKRKRRFIPPPVPALLQQEPSGRTEGDKRTLNNFLPLRREFFYGCFMRLARQDAR